MQKFLLTFILCLAGCQSPERPPLQALPVVEPEPVVEEAPPALAEPVIEEEPAPRFVIENILTLTPLTVRDILGPATLIRREKDVRVWMYHNSECVLHLYFYPDDNGDFRLDYVDARGASGTTVNPTVSPNACLDSHVIPEPSSPEKHINPPPDRSDN